jgi:hypothetical protein
MTFFHSSSDRPVVSGSRAIIAAVCSSGDAMTPPGER